MSDLLDKGYILYSDFFTSEELDKVKSFIIGNTVNYTQMTDFINNTFMKKLNDELKWDSKYVKYRVSNNNNSSDASTFHRDVIKWNENIKIPNVDTDNIYTCLTYLDSTSMELIPYSHTNKYLNIFNAVLDFPNAHRINLKCGDVLVFNANLLHRGVFENVDLSADRRLIQVFDVHPTKEQYDLLAKHVYHLPAGEQRLGYASLLTKLSRYTLCNGIINTLGYLNAATGYGYTNDKEMDDFLNTNDLSSCIYLSSEGTRKRLYYGTDCFEESNVYILMDTTNDVKNVDNVLKKAYDQNLQFYVLLFIIIIIITCIGLVNAYNFIKPTKKIIANIN